VKTTHLPKERILHKILNLRNEKVMLDFHLAELYKVETRVLKQAVKRNMDRFPDDFIFELSHQEIDYLVSQNVIPSKKRLGGAQPYAFTEAGVAMLSSVLRSKRAIDMNVAIVRTFIQLRKMANNYDEILKKVEQMEARYDLQFAEIYQALLHLTDKPKPSRPKIGHKK
jgi:hypothetical protein